MRAISIIAAFFIAGLFWTLWQDFIEPSGLTHVIGIFIALGFFFWVWDWSKRFSKPGNDNEKEPGKQAGNKPASDIVSDEIPSKVSPQQPKAYSQRQQSKSNSSFMRVDIAVIAGFILLIGLVYVLDTIAPPRTTDTTAVTRTTGRSGSDTLSWETNEPMVVNALRQWAEVGNIEAQFNMGYRHVNGEGVIQDYARAFCWYQHAAERGHAMAMNNLGVRYRRGQGVEQDRVLAHKWFNLAAARGNELGQRNRSEIANSMDQEQIEQAQELAREWERESNENPFLEIPRYSGVRYSEPGQAPPDDYERQYFCD